MSGKGGGLTERRQTAMRAVAVRPPSSMPRLEHFSCPPPHSSPTLGGPSHLFWFLLTRLPLSRASLSKLPSLALPCFQDPPPPGAVLPFLCASRAWGPGTEPLPHVFSLGPGPGAAVFRGRDSSMARAEGAHVVVLLEPGDFWAPVLPRVRGRLFFFRAAPWWHRAPGFAPNGTRFCASVPPPRTSASGAFTTRVSARRLT